MNRMDNTNAYILARLQGFNPQAALQNVMQQEQRTLAERANGVVQQLVQNQEAIEQDFQELEGMIRGADVLQEPRERVANLEQVAQDRKRARDRLTEVLAKAKQELKDEQLKKAKALKDLQEYRMALLGANNANQIGAIYQFGTQACKTMSGHSHQKAYDKK